MNDAFYTQTGERPDLAAIEVNPPEGYIGTKILPVVPVAEKSGTIYYATVTADSAAQTSRSTGAGPTATQISNSSTTFSCGEACKRGAISPDEVKTMGGIEKADEVGAKFAKRSVMNKLEADIAAAILDSADDTFDAAKFLTQSQTALDSIRRYEGKTALIGGTKTLKTLVQSLIASNTYGKVFARLISGASPAEAATGMNFDAWMNGLAMFLGIDTVLAGDDNIWAASGSTAEMIAFAKLDEGTDPLSHKWKPVLGKVFQFLPDGKQPWVIQSVGDRVTVNNYYDAYLWYQVKILNSSAVYVIGGVTA